MLDQYRETEIRTASPEMLVVKMYEGAIRFARQAIDMNESGRLVAVSYTHLTLPTIYSV